MSEILKVIYSKEVYDKYSSFINFFNGKCKFCKYNIIEDDANIIYNIKDVSKYKNLRFIKVNKYISRVEGYKSECLDHEFSDSSYCLICSDLNKSDCFEDLYEQDKLLNDFFTGNY